MFRMPGGRRSNNDRYVRTCYRCGYLEKDKIKLEVENKYLKEEIKRLREEAEAIGKPPEQRPESKGEGGGSDPRKY